VPKHISELNVDASVFRTRHVERNREAVMVKRLKPQSPATIRPSMSVWARFNVLGFASVGLALAVNGCGKSSDDEAGVKATESQVLEAPPDYQAPAPRTDLPTLVVQAIEEDPEKSFAPTSSASKTGGSEGQSTRPRHTDDVARCSFEIPEGWKVVFDPKRKVKVVTGPLVNGFTSNIVTIYNANAGSPNAFAEASLRAEVLPKSGSVVESRMPFVTRDGLPGVRTISIVGHSKRQLRQTMYCFPHAKKGAVALLFSVVADGGSEYDHSFQSVAKSYKIH